MGWKSFGMFLLGVLISASGCDAGRPDEDLRIVSARPVARLSAADLVADYEKDAGASDARYRGHAIDITGRVLSVLPEAEPTPALQFHAATGGVRAHLIKERAPALLSATKPGDRVWLRCFVSGRSERSTDIVLKSCVVPGEAPR